VLEHQDGTGIGVRNLVCAGRMENFGESGLRRVKEENQAGVMSPDPMDEWSRIGR
jgi:hypothetical protein